jgi:hypothetical protein
VGDTLAVLTGPVIGAQHGPLPELWAAIAGMTAVAALWASTMEVLADAWSFIPIFGLLMVVAPNVTPTEGPDNHSHPGQP